MPHPYAAMLPSPSSLRCLLHLSRRLHLHRFRAPNPRLPSPPLLTHLRLRSSSSSPSDGAGWATYDPLNDSLAPSAAISSASASDPETPADSDVWGVFDPVAGRIVMQGQPYPRPPPPSSSEEEEEEEKESVEEEAVKGKGKGKSSGGKGQVRWSAVAAVRKAAKEKVSYVCSHCGEGFSQWWGVCRHCQAMGTLTKYVPEPHAAAAVEGSHHAVRSWIPQKSKEMMPQSLQEVTKGVDQAEWRIPLPGSFGMEIARVLGGGIVPGKY